MFGIRVGRVKLDRSHAPGLKPASAELFPDEAAGGVIRTSSGFVVAVAALAGPGDRATANQDACISNLRIIDAAKGQWALEYHKQNSDTPTMEEMVFARALNASRETDNGF